MSYTHTASTVTSVLLVMTLTWQLPGPAVEPTRTATPGTAAKTVRHTTPETGVAVGPLTVHTDDATRIDDAVWAIARFETADLDLPDVTVYLHGDRSDCSDDPDRPINGYYAEVDQKPVVHVCAERRTLLHELAHAWDHAFLDDETREQFLALQGLSEWHAEEWRDSGAEHLASVFAWALEGTHPTLIGYYTRTELANAYELATGMVVPDEAVGTIDRPPHEPDSMSALPVTYRGEPS